MYVNGFPRKKVDILLEAKREEWARRRRFVHRKPARVDLDNSGLHRWGRGYLGSRDGRTGKKRDGGCSN